MKYKFSLITIAFLAFNLNAAGVKDCDSTKPDKCDINILEQNQTITNQSVRLTGTHNINSINVSGTLGANNTYNHEFDHSANSKINTLTAKDIYISQWARLEVLNATLDNSKFNHGYFYGNTKFENLTLKNNSTYINTHGNDDKITNLKVENGATINAEKGHLHINNILSSDNLVVNITTGGSTITNIAQSAGIAPIFNLSGGELNFKNNGVINQANINHTNGKLNVNGSTLNNTSVNTSGGSINITNAKINNGNIDIKDTAGYLTLEGNIDFNGTNISKQSPNMGSHNIVVKNNSVVNFNDANLSNLSINANSVSDKASYVNVKGGNLTNTSIGTVKSKINGKEVLLGMSHLTLDGVNIDNSALSADKNIIAEHLAIKNIDGTTKNIKANISVDKDLLIDNAVLDANTNILSGETIATNSTINGVIVADTLKSNQTNFIGKVHTGDIVSTNSTFQNAIVTGDINDSGSSFNGTVSAVSVNAQGSTFANTVDALSVNANGATFKQDVNINCTNQAGFTCTPSIVKDTKFETSLTLGGNTNITLDNSSSVNNLTLGVGTTVAVNGASAITGTINNDGVIKLNNGTISEAITGSGDLYTFKVTYDKAVESSDVKGSNSTFNNTVKATENMVVDNATFNNTVTVANATNNANLYAYQGNEFKADVIADNAFLRYDSSKDSSKGNQITIDTSLTANNNLNINDITVKAKELKSDLANISNSTINSKLTGKNDASMTVYASGALSGEYSISNSDITGGIRVKDLKISGSKIKSQVIVDTLEATNNTFYVFGGGTNTSFYDYYSGAIIVKKGAIGSGNTIQLSNTNLGLLTQGFVPIAIVKDDSYVAPPVAGPITMALNTTATGGGSISKDFFRVAYKTKIAEYELADQFLTYQEKDGKYVWSVGVAGNNKVDIADVDAIINGTNTASIATGINDAGVDYSKIIVDIGNMFNFNGFDDTAINSAKFIIASPEYLARTKLNIPYNRYQVFKSNKTDNGVWMNNKNGYSKYKNSSIRYSDINIGADKVTTVNNNISLMLGLAANIGLSSTSGDVISEATSKGIGLYAMSMLSNGAFFGIEAFYHNIDTSYEAQSLGINTDKRHNVYTASLQVGQRFGEDFYIEPSLKYDMTTYKPNTINGDGVSIEGDRQTIHTLGVNVQAGMNIADKLDSYIGIGYAKELTNKQDLHIQDSVRPHTIAGDKGDESIRANLGLNYNITKNATINADFGYNKYSNDGKEYKTNIGFAYRF